MAESPRLQLSCIHCQGLILFRPEEAGQTIACPSCQAPVLLPAPGGAQEAPGFASSEQPAQVQTLLQEAPLASLAAAPSQPQAIGFQAEAVYAAPPKTAAQSPVAAPAGTWEYPAASPPVSSQTALPDRASQEKSKMSEYATPLRTPALRRTPLLLASLLGLGILALAVVTITNSIAHAQLVQELDEGVRRARGALEAGELEKANGLAREVRGKLDDPEARFEEPQLAGWRNDLKEIDEVNEHLKRIDEVIATAEKDPSAARTGLEKKRILLDGKNPKTRPLLLRLEEGLAKAVRLEREAFVRRLTANLERAESACREGRIEEAAQQAREVDQENASQPGTDTEPLKPRLQRLIAQAERLAGARNTRANASADFASARQRMGKLLEELKAEDELDRPLRGQLEKLLKEIVLEEQSSLKLSPADLKQLSKLVEQLKTQEPGIEVLREDRNSGIEFTYKQGRLALGLTTLDEKNLLLLIAQGHRFLVDERELRTLPGLRLKLAQEFGAAMTARGVEPQQNWTLVLEAPLPLARCKAGEGYRFFYRERPYQGTVNNQLEQEKKTVLFQLEQAAKSLGEAIKAEETIPEDTRKVILTLVQGAHSKLNWNDHLPTDFCQQVLDRGYLELNLRSLGTKVKEALGQYREAYRQASALKPFTQAANEEGDELDSRHDALGHRVLRTFDRKGNQTTIAVRNPIPERPGLYIVYTFEGQHKDWPAELAPLRIEMTHPALGVVSSFDVAKGQLVYDEKQWAKAAALTALGRRLEWRGAPEWEFPPHVLLVNAQSEVRGLVTPAGRVDLPDFKRLEKLEERRAAQEKYLGQLAQVLHTTGHLHLYFLYFHQYVLDSPIVTAPNLLGSSAHCGDIHQTVLESMDRELGGKYLGDCDDLAELYMDLTRRQGKLSFVMNVPGHATCGWVEKGGAGYRLQFLDTGPPRIFEDGDIEKLVETGSRSYDLEKTMRFDPKSLGFLFRFAGESTRTPYYLSTRMFVDRQYAETMERVQSYWHFHFYALGIKTMEEMIAKGDKVSENCTELAGLYGRVHEFEKAVQWTGESLKQLGEKDVLTRQDGAFRIGMDLHEAKEDAKAYAAIQDAVQELKRLYGSPESLRFVSQRLSLSSLLTELGRPWEAWDLIKPDALFFAQRGALRLEHAGSLTRILKKMKELGAKTAPKPEEEKSLGQLEKLLDWFFKNALFRREDDFNDILRNYAFLGSYYGVKYGEAKLREELLKPGPYPQKNKNHLTTPRPESEDWQWIRIAPLSYGMVIGEALDPDKPVAEQRREDAVKLGEMMFQAAGQAKQFGSLGANEMVLYTARTTHALLTKQWAEFEKVLKEGEEENYARLTASVAETFGEGARFLTPEEFVAQYQVFARYTQTKAPYFNVVYSAYRAEAFEHARAAAQEALKKWPENEDMKREVQFLEELVKHRLLEKAKKEAQAREQAPKEAAPKGPETPKKEEAPAVPEAPQAPPATP